MTPAGVLLPARSALPRGLWPFRPQPMPDEILSSYIARTASGMGMAPVSFLTIMWGAHRRLLQIDLDGRPPDDVVDRIAAGLAVDPASVRAMTLADHDGRLIDESSTRGPRPWILPTFPKSNRRLRHGLQFCPACLAEDAKPHFRRTWRIAFATCCVHHGIELHDRCFACREPVHIHMAPSMRHCFRCRTDLAQGLRTPVPPGHVAFQSYLEGALAEGWCLFAGAPLHAQMLFQILRRLAWHLIGGRRGDLRTSTARLWGGDAAPFPKVANNLHLEILDAADRRRLFDLLRRLLEDWPVRFVEACKGAGLRRWHFVRDVGDARRLPFALDRVLEAELDRQYYVASREEVASVAAWLRRTKGAALFTDLRAICGSSRNIYCHMDYVRPPKRRSALRRPPA